VMSAFFPGIGFVLLSRAPHFSDEAYITTCVEKVNGLKAGRRFPAFSLKVDIKGRPCEAFSLAAFRSSLFSCALANIS